MSYNYAAARRRQQSLTGWYAWKDQQHAARQKREQERALAAQIAALMAEAGDSRKKQVEAQTLRRFVPAGPWDADCEAHPEASYHLEIGAGFKAKIWRGPRWQWIGSLTFPSWYPFRYGYHPCHFTPSYGELPPSPVKIRYGEQKDGESIYSFSYEDETAYGTYRPPQRHACPLDGPLKPRQSYKGFERAVEDMWLLVGHLVSILYTHKEIQLETATDEQRAGFDAAFEANQEALLKIREQDMRVLLATKERRDAEAAQEAAWAAEDAAAAKAAADAAARAQEERAEAYETVRELARVHAEWSSRVSAAEARLAKIRSFKGPPEREGERERLEEQAAEAPPASLTSAAAPAILAKIQIAQWHPIFKNEKMTPTRQVRALEAYLRSL